MYRASVGDRTGQDLFVWTGPFLKDVDFGKSARFRTRRTVHSPDDNSVVQELNEPVVRQRSYLIVLSSGFFLACG